MSPPPSLTPPLGVPIMIEALPFNKNLSFPEGPNLEAVPNELKATRRWVLWKSDPIFYKAGKPKVDKGGNPQFGKVPYNVKNDQKADTTDASTWSSFDETVVRLNKGGFDGIGFVLGYDEETGHTFAGVDIDHLETSEDWQRARQVADRFASYTEISPSKKGIHIIVFGEKNGERCKDSKKNIEIYDHSRFFTVTGNVLDGKKLSVNFREEVLREFYRETFPDRKAASSPLTPPQTPVAATASCLSDEEIISLACNEKGPAGEKFRNLYMTGDASDYGDDDSSADMALMNKLAFYSKDPLQLERLFSNSALGQREKWVKRADYRQRTIQAALEFVKEAYAPMGKGRKKGKKTLAAIVATAMLEKYTLRTIRENSTILVLEPGGGWRDFEDSEIGALVQKIAGRDQTTNAMVVEVIGKLKRENLISIDDFERRPDLLMDASGKVFSSLACNVVDINTLKDVVVAHKIGAVFDPTAPVPPEFLKMVSDIIPEAEERSSLQEHVGSGFHRVAKFKKAVVLVGGNDSGKTTLMEVIKAVAGEDNVSAVPLQDMAKTYRPYAMWRKLFNFGDDLNKEALRNVGSFKAQTGGSSITIEKKYGDPIEVYLYAKNWYNCNLLPPAVDKDDEGYYSRFLLIHTPHKFLLRNKIGKDGLQEGEFLADPELLGELTGDPQKLSGILNWCLEGLARLESQQCYSLKMTDEENQVRYDAMAAPVGDLEEFMQMICSREDSSQIMRKADFVWLYTRYCRARKIPAPTLQKVNKGLKTIGFNPNIRIPNYKCAPLVDREDLSKSSPYILRGIAVKTNWTEILAMWESIIQANEKDSKYVLERENNS